MRKALIFLATFRYLGQKHRQTQTDIQIQEGNYFSCNMIEKDFGNKILCASGKWFFVRCTQVPVNWTSWERIWFFVNRRRCHRYCQGHGCSPARTSSVALAQIAFLCLRWASGTQPSTILSPADSQKNSERGKKKKQVITLIVFQSLLFIWTNYKWAPQGLHTSTKLCIMWIRAQKWIIILLFMTKNGNHHDVV